MKMIDLNCDMGEGVGNEAALLEVVTSANVACGGHAGDEETMRAVVRGAVLCGVAVGAHPSYPDRAGFGRLAMTMSAAEIEEAVRGQVAWLDRVAREEGAEVRHVKPHGALYHAAMSDREVARAVAAGVRRVRSGLVMVGLAGAKGLAWWREEGLTVAAEAFADRRYVADGSLRARDKDGAMIEDPREAAEQAVRIAERRGVVTADGAVVAVEAQTICVHGDSAGAVEIAHAVRAALEERGVKVAAL